MLLMGDGIWEVPIPRGESKVSGKNFSLLGSHNLVGLYSSKINYSGGVL